MTSNPYANFIAVCLMVGLALWLLSKLTELDAMVAKVLRFFFTVVLILACCNIILLMLTGHVLAQFFRF